MGDWFWIYISPEGWGGGGSSYVSWRSAYYLGSPEWANCYIGTDLKKGFHNIIKFNMVFLRLPQYSVLLSSHQAMDSHIKSVLIQHTLERKSIHWSVYEHWQWYIKYGHLKIDMKCGHMEKLWYLLVLYVYLSSVWVASTIHQMKNMGVLLNPPPPFKTKGLAPPTPREDRGHA